MTDTPEPAQPAGACICDAACPMTEDRHWINCPAHKYYANYLALQPAQPAESPEARARLALARELPQQNWDRLRTSILSGSSALHSDPVSWVVEAAVRAIVAASTARPTERGAVEAAVGLANKLWNQWYDRSNRDDPKNTLRALISAIRALALPATDQAGEVDLCRKDGQPCYVGRGTDDAHHRCGTVQCGMRKALATQPATGRTAEHLPMTDEIEGRLA